MLKHAHKFLIPPAMLVKFPGVFFFQIFNALQDCKIHNDTLALYIPSCANYLKQN